MWARRNLFTIKKFLEEKHTGFEKHADWETRRNLVTIYRILFHKLSGKRQLGIEKKSWKDRDVNDKQYLPFFSTVSLSLNRLSVNVTLGVKLPTGQTWQLFCPTLAPTVGLISRQEKHKRKFRRFSSYKVNLQESTLWIGGCRN